MPSLAGWTYRQEYCCNFEQTDAAVFDAEMVETAITDEVKPLFGTG